MRFAVCERDIINPYSGALNLSYFNNKKGSYWSDRETKLLKKLLCLYAPTEFQRIKNHEEVGQEAQAEPFMEA